MKKILTSRHISMLLAVMLLLGTMIMPASATTASNVPDSIGTVVLQEDFSSGAANADIAGWNGWTLDSGYVEGTNVVDANFNIVELKNDATLFKADSGKSIATNGKPLEKIAKIHREKSNGTSASMYVKKSFSVPAGNNLLSLRYRVMHDSNANIISMYLAAGNSIFEIASYLNRSQNHIIYGGVAEQITTTTVNTTAALKWYDVEYILDFTDNYLYAYIDGTFAGKGALQANFLKKITGPEKVTSIYLGSSRAAALVTGTAPGNFYLDDVTVTAIPAASRNAVIAQKLRRFVPGSIASPWTANGKAATSTLSLPTTGVFESTVSWSSDSNLVAVSGGNVTITHPATGDAQTVNLTATITPADGTPVTYTYPIQVAQKDVYIIENFEGSFKEKYSSGIAGHNGWYTEVGMYSTQPDFTTTEEYIKEEDGNYALKINRLLDSKNSPTFEIKKNIGRTFSSAVAPNGASIKFKLKSNNDDTNLLNVNLGSTLLSTIMMTRGSLVLSDSVHYFFGEQFKTLSSSYTYPLSGAIAGKWYDIEIVTDMTAGGTEKIYADGKLIATTTRPAAITGTCLTLAPNRTAMGTGGDFMFDDIMLKPLSAIEKEIRAAADAVTLFDNTFYSDITLPATVGDGISVTWESGDESILTDDGKIVTEYTDATTITGTFTKSGEAFKRTYDVSIGAKHSVEIASVSAATKTAVVNIHAPRLTGVSKLIVAAYKDNQLIDLGDYDVPNEITTCDVDLSTWWTDEIPADADIRAFVFDLATIQPQVKEKTLKANAKTLWMCGDSTMDSYVYPGKNAAEPEERRLTGWGEYFSAKFEPTKLVVENWAVSGRTTATFLANEWTKMAPLVKEGDYVLIQFGHNDQKYSTHDEYAEDLTTLVNAAREKGAIPIFATSINRKTYVNGVFTQDMAGYPEKMLEVAETLDIPVIDLYAATAKWLTEEGEAATVKHFRKFMDGIDYTHLTPMGARVVCDMAVSEILANAELADLAACFK